MTPEDTVPVAAALPPPEVQRLPLRRWLVAGLGAGFGLPARTGQAVPTPWQLLLLFAIPSALETALARLEIAGTAVFEFHSWLFALCGLVPLVFLAWASLARPGVVPGHPAPVPAWLGLWMVAVLAPGLAGGALYIATMRGLVPERLNDAEWLWWLVFALMCTWLLAITWRLSTGFTRSRAALAGLLLGVLLVQGLDSMQFGARPWQTDYSALDNQRPPALTLSQEVFEDQQALLATTLANLLPRQAGRTNVFGLVYAPYAQEVFARESAMVAGVLQDRFNAKGHVVQLVNSPRTTTSLPWATNRNLQRSIQAVAERMDHDKDLLVLYLSSHGGADFRLATSHGPLEVEELTGPLLRRMLDDAGVRHRVIAVSACYSGGWVAPLVSDTTLVMTAADATHTSYGCGSKSELTFFGRAVFDEQLRNTRSFEAAFIAAVPIIRQREIEGGKADGFSNPQMVVGKDMRPVLEQLVRELQP